MDEVVAVQVMAKKFGTLYLGKEGMQEAFSSTAALCSLAASTEMTRHGMMCQG